MLVYRLVPRHAVVPRDPADCEAVREARGVLPEVVILRLGAKGWLFIPEPLPDYLVVCVEVGEGQGRVLRCSPQGYLAGGPNLGV